LTDVCVVLASERVSDATLDQRRLEFRFDERAFAAGDAGAYSVWQRIPEIGVRMALGARTGDLLRMVVGGGMRLVVTGVVLGGLASLLLTRALQSQLYGVSATDPLAFAVALAILIGVAFLACYIPARRASRSKPSRRFFLFSYSGMCLPTASSSRNRPVSTSWRVATASNIRVP
jgi:hypothetical protein